MSYKIYLGGYDSMIDFMNYATDIDQFGTRRFVLMSMDGAMMNIDTRTNNGSYMQFVHLKDYISIYKENNGNRAITVDIKLICPEGQRRSIDPNGYYSNFFMNFYSSGSITYIGMSYEESGRELVEAPFIAWCAYVTQIHKKWTLYAES